MELWRGVMMGFTALKTKDSALQLNISLITSFLSALIAVLCVSFSQVNSAYVFFALAVVLMLIGLISVIKIRIGHDVLAMSMLMVAIVMHVVALILFYQHVTAI